MKSLNAAAGFARLLVLSSTLAAMALFSDGLGTNPSAPSVHAHLSEAGGAEGPIHDVALTGCLGDGPGPVNLSDTTGAIMLVLCKATNLGSHDDAVVITRAGDLLTSSLPGGCAATASLVIPGRTDFMLLAGEQKQLLWRVRFECHAPAVESIVPLTIEIAIEHVVQSDGVGDNDPANNSVTLIESMIIGQETPTPTPVPTPSSVLDSDGDGYTDAAEASIGTRADKPCGDGWPSNLVHSGLSFNRLDLEDMSSFVAPVRRLNSSLGDMNFNVRWDLVPGITVGETINVQDMAALSPSSSSSMMYPPMLSGAQAFGQTCPWPP
jgi:hypothetical protein